MSNSTSPALGSVTWFDLTVPDATALAAFYEKVVGWTRADFDMGGYHDYCLNEPASGKTVAGICHARGPNTEIPPQWLIYITVANLEESVKQCLALGGQVLAGPRSCGGQGQMVVIKDPAGAVAALFEPTKTS